MKFLISISVAICFLFSFQLSFGQAYLPPQPRMSKIVLKDFINMHIEYPSQALINKEEGVVRIRFNIDKEGNISNQKISASVSGLLDSAAIRLFSMILWEPAKYYGKATDGEGEFKLKYSIGKYNSIAKKRGYDHIPVPFEPIDRSGKIFTVKELEKAPAAILDSTYPSVQEFIGKNLDFPEAAAKLSIAGDVKLRFVIEPNGLPSNIMVIQAVGGGCTEEAIRIVQQIRWMPGIKNATAVRTCYNISIKFDPADELRNKHIPNQSNTGI